jgi:hypothetical protein
MKPAATSCRLIFHRLPPPTLFHFIKAIARYFQSKLVALHVRPPVVNPMTQPATRQVDIEAANAFDKEHRDELLDTFAGIETEVLYAILPSKAPSKITTSIW